MPPMSNVMEIPTKGTTPGLEDPHGQTTVFDPIAELASSLALTGLPKLKVAR
jgi:hypothetical protein